MDIVGVLLVACALSMDCFAVSLSVGLCRKETSQLEILRIGLFFGLFQTGMTLAGAFCGTFLAEIIGIFDHWIAFGLLAFIGTRMIWEAIHGGEEQTFSQRLSYRTLATLAVATSLDALAVGLSFALIGHEIPWTSAVIGIVAFLSAEFGVNSGKYIGEKFSPRIAEAIGGGVLILIGVKILIEHLTTEC